MNDFEERRPAHRVPAAMAGQGGSGAVGSVHQVVFRWDGNQGRQGTGMKAVAHSCEAERAEELGRELGPLLWVSGARAPRQSVVRTQSRDGGVMLVQRWPTTDRGGRPSTVSHVLLGESQTLKTRQCLGLAHGGWGSRESAEKATGRQRMVECAELDALARKRLPGMRELLPTVRDALIQVTAELLRDPTQRVSLLTDGEELPGWPDQDGAPLVYLGLFLLFGPWLGQEWTFATYDTVDTHALRLMSVPRWEQDAGGVGPLARVKGPLPATPEFEHRAAVRLVNHLLAHPADGPGVPQLVHGLRDGAALEWSRRRARLNEILNLDRRTSARTTAPSARRPQEKETAHAPNTPPPDLKPAPAPEPQPQPAPASPPPSMLTPPPASAPMSAAAPPSPPVSASPPPPVSAPPSPPVSAPPSPPVSASAPPSASASAPLPASPSPSLPASPSPSPSSPPTAPSRPIQTPAPRSAAPGTGGPVARGPAARGPAAPHEVPSLHEDLRVHQRRNTGQREQLAERLQSLPDERLLHELRSGELPPESMELLLDELGEEHRVQIRRTSMRHQLCEEVLRNGLYFSATPNAHGAEAVSRTAMASRAADLFTWAVAPLARDERYLRDLQELLHRMGRDRHPAAGNWLWQSIIAPANGQAPDLPPVVWQQILRDMISQKPVSATTPTTSHAGSLPTTSPAPTTIPESAGPESTTLIPKQPTLAARLSDPMNNPGCVVGSLIGVIAVLTVFIVWWFFA